MGRRARLRITRSLIDAIEGIEEQVFRLAIEVSRKAASYTVLGRTMPEHSALARSFSWPTLIHLFLRYSCPIYPSVSVICTQDCFRDAARESTESPELAIIQHESGGPLNYVLFCRRCHADRTRPLQGWCSILYPAHHKCISMACANGDVAPFLGPNTFVRWAALQDAMFEDAGDHKKRKIWSEAHVSEEFDMALRLMVFVFRVSVAPDSDGHTQMDTPSGGRHTQKVASRNVSR